MGLAFFAIGLINRCSNRRDFGIRALSYVVMTDFILNRRRQNRALRPHYTTRCLGFALLLNRPSKLLPVCSSIIRSLLQGFVAPHLSAHCFGRYSAS